MQTSSHVLNAERVTIVAEQVTRRFRRRGNPADPADLHQEAALAALVALRSGNLDESQNPMAYMQRAAIRETGLASTRWLAPVSISEYAVSYDNARVRHLRARPAVHMHDRDVDPEQDRMERALKHLRPNLTPEEILIRREERAASHALSVLRRRTAERYLRRLTAAQREALELLLGWDGRSCQTVAQAARMVGTTSHHVNDGIKRFKRMAWDDIDLRRLQRRAEAIDE